MKINMFSQRSLASGEGAAIKKFFPEKHQGFLNNAEERRALIKIRALSNAARKTKNHILKAIIKKKESRARHAFILRNTPLMVRVCQSHASERLSFEDSLQEGIFGLMKAIQKYDPERKSKFSTIAAWWILYSVQHRIQDCEKHRVVKIPEHAARAVRESFRHKSPDLAGKVSQDMLAAALSSYSSVSEFFSQETGEFVSIVEQIEDNAAASGFEKYSRRRESEMVRKIINGLASREATVVRLGYGIGGAEEPLTLREIADITGLSRERVRQIEKMAIDHLRKNTVLRMNEIKTKL